MEGNWPVVLLGDVVREEREPVGTFDGDGLPIYGVTNVEGVIQTGVKPSEDRSKYLHLRPGRFVYNPYRINVGSLGLSSQTQDGIVSPAYVVFTPNEKIDHKFLYYFLKSPRGSQLINFYGNRGSVRSALRFTDLCKIEVNLPATLGEQQRIVNRIEEFSAQVQEANHLNQKAMAETEILLGARVSELFRSSPEKGWVNGKLGAFVSDDCYGTSEKTSDDETGTPVLRMGNIQKGRIDIQNLRYLHLSEKDKAKLLLRSGDILVNRTNSAELVGKSAVFDLEGDYSFASYLIRLRLDRHRADPWLVAAYINSPLGREYMLSEKRQMTGQANVNCTKLKALPIALPTLEEQQRIVAEMNTLQSEVETLKRLQVETSVELNALLSSLIHKAFKREL